MKKSRLPIGLGLGAVVALIGGGAAYVLGRGPAPMVPGRSRRREAAHVAVQRFVPSTYGDERFKEMDPGFSPKILEKYPTYTNCGTLPAAVIAAVAREEEGKAGKFAQAGLELLRTEGRRAGCWREGPEDVPGPYDVFAIQNDDGGIIHVGVAVDTNGTEWTTADAGQGARDKPQALFVKRTWDPVARTLLSNGTPRKLAGFLDLDAIPLGGPNV